jgi:ribonuclease HII
MSRLSTKRFGVEQSLLRKGFDLVVGCDEVGRGALAGPVVAAAVIFDRPSKEAWWEKITDSKKLSPPMRNRLADNIMAHAVGYGIGEVLPQVIDEVNIHEATLRAMRDAVRMALVGSEGEVAILVDGKFPVPTFDCYQQTIVDGDYLVQTIGAASILAKVYRDSLMSKLDYRFPEYAFGQHKGYATPVHRKAIAKHGLTIVHRSTFCGNIV